MGYQLGVDLGTTFTAAAICRDGGASIFSLGERSAAIPSVVHLREDETVLTGDAAVRRALSEPDRVAREFKRRLGDTTPIIVGGTPYSAEALMARVLTHVVREVEEREAEGPERIAISHPANWGPYKIGLLDQAIRLAGLDPDRVQLLTEPEAAAIHYASQERVEPGEIIAVYDLGGGTFDAAVMRKTDTGFELMGRPEGIERLGGIDFDAAVFAHVSRALGDAISELDTNDPRAVAAVTRLRQDCVEAKEALSSDTDASIPVMLPNFQTEFRITRAEFESLIRPALADSIEAMKRALSSAGVTADEVSRVLLVGGSSRIPLISQLVSSQLGRPLAVDAHPKHAIALGAAYSAAAAMGAGINSVSNAPAAPAAPVIPVAEPVLPPSAAEPVAPFVPVAPAPAPAPAAVPAAAAAVPPVDVVTPRPEEHSSVGQGMGADAPGGVRGGPSGPKLPVLVGGVLALVVLVGGAAFALSRGGDDDQAGEDAATAAVLEDDPADDVAPVADTADSTPDEPAWVDAAEVDGIVGNWSDVQTAVGASVDENTVTLTGVVIDDAARGQLVAAIEALDGEPTVTDQLTVVPEDERCTEAIRSQPLWGCLLSAAMVDDTTIRIEYIAETGGEDFNVNGGNHLHLFGSNVDPETAGAPGDASIGGGTWLVWDEPAVVETTAASIFGPGAIPDKVCVRIATPSHTLHGLDTGQCAAIA